MKFLIKISFVFQNFIIPNSLDGKMKLKDNRLYNQMMAPADKSKIQRFEISIEGVKLK